MGGRVTIGEITGGNIKKTFVFIMTNIVIKHFAIFLFKFVNGSLIIASKTGS
jgi:hypothetical protein